MIEQGRRGFVGHLLVKMAFQHKATGKQYDVGDYVEGYLVEHCGEIVFEFFDVDDPEAIDPEKFDPANFERDYGIWCMIQIANDCSDGKGSVKDCTWYFDKGEYLIGRVCSRENSVVFLTDKEHFGGVCLPLELFQDDWEGLEYKDGIGYEIEEIPRFFNVLG